MAKPPHTKCSNESILPGFQMAGISRRLDGYDPRLTACLVVYQHARLDSVTIPEYFAPPGVFCACLCEESEAVEISSGGDSYDGD